VTGAGRIAVAAALLAVAAGQAPASETFRRLSGSEIRARLVGKEVTDEVHWAYSFERGGGLRVVSLGRARAARWRLDGDGLCLDGQPCVEVWMAGNRVEFRRGEGTLPEEGVLQAPASQR
jgi:hypothetical protein